MEAQDDAALRPSRVPFPSTAPVRAPRAPRAEDLRPVGGREATRRSAPATGVARPAPPPFAPPRPVLSPSSLSHAFLFRSLPSPQAAARLRPARAAARPAVTSPDPAPLTINTGVAGAAFPHSLAFRSAAVFPFFPPSLPLLILSRSSALQCDEAESSPHPVLAILLLLALLFYFSFRPPPPLLHSWCRCRAFSPTSSPQPMAQAALGISAQGNHIPL